MDKQNSTQDPDAKIQERIVGDLARQLQVEPEIIRPFLLHTYHELWTGAVVKDFVSIFAMRLVRDKFSGEGAKKSRRFP
ncbi:hypothetical protein [Thiovibrio frasassiensis]|uniref:DUF3562 domain-containing protein n=1 Tax=Thiovibrio frasassiensis TaxID=2984131 RepID=A0A9X4RQE1_9BACT|nr:hypothetical protein [Thiovibrio frasassiensis]MDG4476182.1 hypothetical protein [Thiovibrio frasassiensis]